jgi:hypothetical protein
MPIKPKEVEVKQPIPDHQEVPKSSTATNTDTNTTGTIKEVPEDVLRKILE